MLNAVLFRAFVPPEMEAGQRLTFNHFGMGVVIHPSTTLGDDVLLNHNVTLATRVAIDSLERLRIGDRVSIGAGAIVIGAIEVGADAVIGAGAVVTKSVPARAVVVGNPARVLKMLDAES
jgi:serine O-acetyltransferase